MTLSRRKFIAGAAVLAGACALGVYAARKPSVTYGFTPDPDLLKKAKQLIAANPSFDLHAHPGRSFVKDAENLTGLLKLYALRGTFEDQTVANMKAGSMSAAAFMAVPDFQLLGLEGDGLQAVREFKPGEAWKSYKTQIKTLKQLIDRGLVRQVYTTGDILAAHKNKEIAALLGAEGGDFLEGSLERLSEAYTDGLRIINPMHYHTNEIGDIMTGSPHHKGLSIAGKAIIKEMNKLGIIIDTAHASIRSVSQILDLSEQPVVCSHTHIQQEGGPEAPRFIPKDIALRIADGGGVIGAWPAGIGISTMDEFVTRVFELVDIVGIDHVGIGTDMDANYKPVWDTYRDFPLVVMRMLQRGLSTSEVSKIIGGNGLRVLSKVTH